MSAYEHQAGWKRPALEALGQRLAAARTARGLSRAALARRMGMHPSQLAIIEWGRSGPRRVTVERIAAGLGMEPDLLVSVLTGQAADPIGATAPDR